MDDATMLLRRGKREALVPVGREVLRGIPVTPQGDRSSRWTGVPHGILADTVIERAETNGLSVRNENWSQSRDGARMFGMLDVDAGSAAIRHLDLSTVMSREVRGYNGFDPRIMGLRLGVLNSNDSSFAVAMMVVARVLVCSNGLTVEGGTIALSRKHTGGVLEELPQLVDGGMGTYIEMVSSLETTRQQMLAIDFSRPRDVDHVLVEAGRRSLMPWSKIGQVEEAWRNPHHPEFQRRDGWSLMNAFTEVGKRFNLLRETQTADRVRELVLELNPARN